MFDCLGRDRVLRHVTWAYVNNAWVAAITLCRQRLREAAEPRTSVRNVNDLVLAEEVDGEVSVSWSPSGVYYTEVEYQIGDGEWVSLDLVDIGEDSV